MIPVVHVLASAQPRGGERSAIELADSMTSVGMPGRVVALAAGGPAPRLDVEIVGRQAIRPSTFWRLRGAMPVDGIAIAHGSTALPACAVALARKAPFIYRGIGDPGYWAGSGLRRWRVRRYLSRAAAVVAMWPGQADALRELFAVPANRVHVIPKFIPTEGTSPVDADAKRAARARVGLPEDAQVVAYLGALSAEKDPLLAVESAAHLEPAAHLLVIGDGPLRPEVEARARARMPDRTRFVGQVTDPLRPLAAADALVLSSRTEGIPSAPLEAALLGIPSVVTDVGGASEIVVDGKTGRVVPTRDPSAMAAALTEVLAGSRSLGMAARARCLASYDIRPVAERWAALCRDLRERAEAHGRVR